MQKSLISYLFPKGGGLSYGHIYMTSPDLTQTSVEGMRKLIAKTNGVPVKRLVITSLMSLDPDPVG